MKLTFLRGECGNERTCPNINLTDRDTYVIQGWEVSESAVEVPLSLIPELVGRHAVDSRLQVTDRRTVFVHGDAVTDPEALRELNLPTGESAVEIPLDCLPPEVRSRAR